MRDFDVMKDYELSQNIRKYFNIDVKKYITDKFFPNNESYVITKNKFPYKDIQNHYLVWLNPKFETNYPIEFFKKMLQPHYIFENTPDMRTIKDIRHYHMNIDRANVNKYNRISCNLY